MAFCRGRGSRDGIVWRGVHDGSGRLRMDEDGEPEHKQSCIEKSRSGGGTLFSRVVAKNVCRWEGVLQ